MKLLKKLTSKKGQVSMEIGILVAAAVAVAAIAAYYYIWNVKESHPENAGISANKAIVILGNKSVQYANSISNL
ncbi:class III signal peptide-containing protein [Methanococcus aeolicus]|uniref:class III signal peptide-containing protein n=1 Tax=Methanococcus aeolicus TaxID=42879 RepID=UPI0021C90E74|nr:class III signal peptide-containing protein [Methanococcus aeolicus]UXM84242.1 class III signal peptide-containing protein [Methanococcus aeolicus]